MLTYIMIRSHKGNDREIQLADQKLNISEFKIYKTEDTMNKLKGKQKYVKRYTIQNRTDIQSFIKNSHKRLRKQTNQKINKGYELAFHRKNSIGC